MHLTTLSWLHLARLTQWYLLVHLSVASKNCGITMLPSGKQWLLTVSRIKFLQLESLLHFFMQLFSANSSARIKHQAKNLNFDSLSTLSCFSINISEVHQIDGSTAIAARPNRIQVMRDGNHYSWNTSNVARIQDSDAILRESLIYLLAVN